MKDKEIKKNKDVDKNELNWHRTFDNESTQWSFRLAVIVSAWLGASVVYAGLILWLLKSMI